MKYLIIHLSISIFSILLMSTGTKAQNTFGARLSNEFKHLPFLKPELRLNYKLSIQRSVSNADWEWYLYKDENNEYILTETLVPGCMINILTYYADDNCVKIWLDDDFEIPAKYTTGNPDVIVNIADDSQYKDI